MSKPPANDFEKAASESSGAGIVSEFLAFLRFNKKWWLLPILAILLGLGLIILLSGTAAAPFIYTLF